MKRKDRKWWIAVIVLVLGMCGVNVAGQIIYVDANAPGSNDGSSWADAYNYLQDALAEANSNPEVNEIRVARGIYTPDCNSAASEGTGDRSVAFQLIGGVALKGGYAGFGQPDPNIRDVDVYITILSGDLKENDRQVSDPCDLLDDPCRVDNSYHVLTGITSDETAILDGFTITGGNGNDSYGDRNDRGGGMYNHNFDSTTTLVNCTFTNNSARYGGGGIRNRGTLTLTNCTCTNNFALYNGGGIDNRGGSLILNGCTFTGNLAGEWGGGVYSDYTGPDDFMIFTDCTFGGNIAERGGGIYGEGSGPMLIRCIFRSNCATEYGGGMTGDTFPCFPTLIECLFIGNSAGNAGGALYCGWEVELTLTNCTFTGNLADLGGGIYCDDSYGSVLTNCIFWGNTASSGSQIALRSSRSQFISYSDIRGGQAGLYIYDSELTWGQGNIEADPCFAEPGYWDSNGTPGDPNDDYWVDGDYHLKSEGGRWDPNAESWVLDDVTSACIDKGDWSSPIGDEPYPNGGRVNMGAYGGTAQASKSPVITCWEAGECAGQRYGDATCDGVPSLADLFALKAHFGKRAPWTDPECCVDFNHDDSVNLADLFILRANYGSGPYSPSTLNQDCPP